MKIKLFEVRDRSTFIPAFGIKCMASVSENRFLLGRAGYSPTPPYLVLFGYLAGGECHYDPYEWPENPRTMREAHKYISENFDQLETGSVIDVEFILKETTNVKMSERHADPFS